MSATRTLRSPRVQTPRAAILSMDLPMLTPDDSPRGEDTIGSSFRMTLDSAMRMHEELQIKSLHLQVENRRLQIELVSMKQHMNLLNATPRPEQSPKSLTPMLDSMIGTDTKTSLANPTAEGREQHAQFIEDVVREKSLSPQVSSAGLPQVSSATLEEPSPTCTQASHRVSQMPVAGTLSFSKKSTKSKGEGGQSHVPRITRLLTRVEFEFAIVVAIMLNTIIMCCECQYVGLGVGFNLNYPGHDAVASKVWPGAETVFIFFDWFFGILFFLEMVVKLAYLRIKYFYHRKNPGGWHNKDMSLTVASFLRSLQGWNMLDFLCVAAFLFDKSAASLSAVNPQMIRLLRLFRLFRIVRLVHFLDTLDDLYVMTTAISGLTKVLAWAITLLTTMLCCCSLFLVQVLHVTYFQSVTASDLNPDQLEKHHEMYAYFGTSTRCMLSMFEMTLADWPPVARLLSEEVSEWFALLCLVHKLTIGFAVIGVITGVILQETFKVAQTDDIIMLRQKQKQEKIMRHKMESLFCTLDAERDGKLNIFEFCSIAEDPEIKLWLASLDIETDDLKTLFALIDEDDSGCITCEELFARIPRIKGTARGIDVLAMKKELQKGGGRHKGNMTRASW